MSTYFHKATKKLNMFLKPRLFTNKYRISVTFLCLKQMKSTHLERTAHELRTECLSEAEVVKVEDGSPTIKVLTLKVKESNFKFKAGQWVDTMIPDISVVGGFSMWTAPRFLTKERMLGLAIKYSDHPPAAWVHEKCRPGMKVTIRIGGDKIVYDPGPDDPQNDILLLAGGIGINPLFSILNHVKDLHEMGESNEGAVHRPGRLQLLYSASSSKELIFLDQIEEIVQHHPSAMFSQYFVTKSAPSKDCIAARKTLDHRISMSSIADALRNLQMDTLKCYICGPPPMITDMEKYLDELKVKESHIYTEKWW